MNCIECQESLVDHQEALLDAPTRADFEQHLSQCPACQSASRAATLLHERLLAHGQLAAGVSVVNRVMSRLPLKRSEKPEAAPVFAGFWRWALGFGAVAASALVVALFFLSPRGQALAADVMARGVAASARLTSIHLQCRVRSAPAENFLHLDPKVQFTTVEVWKEWEGEGRWRVEKPGRVVVMDGKSTVHFLRPLKSAIKVPAAPARHVPTDRRVTVGGAELPERWAPFDTGWLHALANIEKTLDAELHHAQAKGWKMVVTYEEDAAGALQAVVTLEADSGLPQGDYLHNKTFDTADTRRVYRFDEKTGRLVGAQVYLREEAGDVLIFEVTHIAYNEVFQAEVFQLDLPADVVWQSGTPALPADPKYTGLTAEEAARRFFEACAREDWNEVGAFWPLPINERFKGLGGLKLVSLGASFTSAAYPGRFVPYEITLKDGRAKKFNLALKQDRKTGRWFVDGGL